MLDKGNGLQVVGYLDYPFMEEKEEEEKPVPELERRLSMHRLECSGGAGHADDDGSACARRAEMARRRAIEAKA